MKKTCLICGLVLLKLASPAHAAIVVDDTWTVGAPIPEGNPVGITTWQTFGGLPAAAISDVSVSLDITGGYNGGLYGYLTLQDANGKVATEYLLQNIGTSQSNPFGSPGGGMNVTLSDAGTVNGSIHNAAGIPNGLWLPDSSATLDATFGGLTANGTWTLFLADDFTGGGTSTLQSWGLEVSVVPEAPEAGLMAGFTALLAVVGIAAMGRRRERSPGGK